jgi:hypothetical protein
MSDTNPNAVPKVHPATREILPDDPMEMHGFEVPGDPNLMLTLLVEEYARIGWEADAIIGLAHDPNYQAFHGLQQSLGDEELTARIRQVLSRCGVIRVNTKETVPISERLVQVELPT